MTVRGAALLREELKRLKSVDRPAVIKSKLAMIQEIDVTTIDAKGKVVFGSTVEVYDVDSSEEKVYKIVGEDEADYKEGLISYTSPIARALIGRNEGDEVEFSAPGGDKHMEIIEVRYE